MCSVELTLNNGMHILQKDLDYPSLYRLIPKLEGLVEYDGDIYIVMSKDRRIVCLFAYDNRSYNLFEKKFVAGYQFMRIIRDDEGNEVSYRIDLKDVVLLLENPVVKLLRIR